MLEWLDHPRVKDHYIIDRDGYDSILHWVQRIHEIRAAARARNDPGDNILAGILSCHFIWRETPTSEAQPAVSVFVIATPIHANMIIFESCFTRDIINKCIRFPYLL